MNCVCQESNFLIKGPTPGMNLGEHKIAHSCNIHIDVAIGLILHKLYVCSYVSFCNVDAWVNLMLAIQSA